MGEPESRFVVGTLDVEVFETSGELARQAADDAAAAIREAVAARGIARVAFTTGNSQVEFVDSLASTKIPWERVQVFHLDSYVGISADHPASFRRWIRDRIDNAYHPPSLHLLQPDHRSVDSECVRYAALLRTLPLDLVCMAIGENGHLAFNEPHVCDFEDKQWVRPVQLADETRMQQVGEGHFASVDEVPRSAVTLTIPALTSGRRLQVVAPEERKAAAVAAALTGPIDNGCPASILRTCPDAKMYLDRAAASRWLAARQSAPRSS